MKAFFAIVLLLLPSAPVHAADISMFRNDPQHSGVYRSAPVEQFHRVLWKYRTGGPIISSPAVLGDSVYFGSADGALYALDRTTGSLRWKYATKGRVVSSPAVAAGLVFFTSYDSTVSALDAHSGKLKWTFKTGGEHRFEGTHLHGSQPAAEIMPDVFDVFLSSPLVWNGVVYVGSGDGNIYALDEASGAKKWSFKTGDVVHASPAISGGMLFVGSWDGNFYALDAASGVERWRFRTGQDPNIHNQVGIQSSAAVLNGVVYFGCRDSHLYALDAQTGRQLWAFPTHGSWVVSSPAARGSDVYFATSDSGLLYALDAGTGAVVFSLDFHQWPIFSSPSLAGDMLYLGSWSGKLTAIDLKRRTIAWTFSTESARKNGPALTNPDGTPNYRVAYRSDFYDDLVSGFATMMTAGSILSSPVLAKGVLYVGSEDGNLYAIM